MTQTPSPETPASRIIERPAIWPIFLLAGSLIAVGFTVVLSNRADEEQVPLVRQPSAVSSVEGMVVTPSAPSEGPQTATFSAQPVPQRWTMRMEMTQVSRRGSQQMETALGWDIEWEKLKGEKHAFKLRDVKLGLSSPGNPLRTAIPAQLEHLLSEGTGEMSWNAQGEVTGFKWTMTTNAQMKPALKLIGDALRLERTRFVTQRINQHESWSTQLGWAGTSSPMGASISGGVRVKNVWEGNGQVGGKACAKVVQQIEGDGEIVWPIEGVTEAARTMALKVDAGKSQGVLCHSVAQNLTLGHDFKVVTSWHVEEELWQESEVRLRTRLLEP